MFKITNIYKNQLNAPYLNISYTLADPEDGQIHLKLFNLPKFLFTDARSQKTN